MKIAKSKDKWVVQHPKDGWVDADGKSVKVPASPKVTRFFADLASAKAAGFSPSPSQAAVLEAAEKKAAAPAAPAAPK